MTRVVLFGAAFALALSGHSPQAPAQPQTGTSVIQGRVVDGVTNMPVKGAMVSVFADPTTRRPNVLTNADGTFAFRDLPAGAYTINAQRPGYFGGSHGVRRPMRSGVPFELGNNDRRTDLLIPIWRMGSISGTVTDDTGRPIGGVTVHLVRSNTAQLVPPAMGMTTNDLGEYSFFGVPPGTYIVAVTPLYGTRPVARPIGVAAFNGTPLGVTATPFNAWSELTGSLDATGQYEQTIFGVPVLPMSADGRSRVYPPTFAASARTVADARSITIATGEDRRGIDIELRPTPGVRVSGTVSSAAPLTDDVMLRLLASPGDSRFVTALTFAEPDGSFAFGVVPAGSYTLEALRQLRPEIATSDPLGLFASMPLVVGDRDVTGVGISLRAGATVGGRIVIEGPMSDADQKKLTAYLDPVADPDAIYPVAPGVQVRDLNDSFAMTGVQPGRFLVGVSGLPNGWALKSVFSGGRNLSLAALEIGGADVTDLELTVTDHVSAITGAVRDGRGLPTNIASVIVMPADRSAWLAGTRAEHGMRAVRALGQYSFLALPAGDYLVAAVDDAQMDDWPNATFLATIAARATRVTLMNGERKTVDLVVR